MKTLAILFGVLLLSFGSVSLARQSPAASPNIIWLTTSVVHKDGHLVTNLTAKDFEIDDNGERRDVVAFRNDSIPMALAIMVDISSSMESNYGLVRRAVDSLTSQFQPGDRAIVGSFDALPWIGGKFSARPEVIRQTLGAALGANAVAGTLSLCDGDWIDRVSLSTRRQSSYGAVTEFSRRLAIHGGSAVWDGAACGINAAASDSETPRRVLLLLTDGVDSMSFSKVAQVVERANRYGVMVYAVSLMGGYGMAGGELRGLAEQTGGGYFFLSGEDKVAAAFAQIGDELRHQYVVGFAPTTAADAAHKIVVRAKAEDATVRFRRVAMDMPTGRPIAQGGVDYRNAGTGGSSALPKSFAISQPIAKSEDTPASAARRAELWTSLDQFVRLDWQSGTAPRMNIEQLRSTVGVLRRDGAAWIRAGAATDQPARRIAAAGFVLDLLYSQNDPFVWIDNQPVPDFLDWAADVLQAGPPSGEERLWYFGALALGERAGVPELVERLAARAAKRFPDEGRFALARGVAQDLRTWPEERDLRAFTPSPDIAAAIVARYEEASAFQAVRAEALLRLAYFDLRRGRTAESLARFDAIGSDPIDDQILRYWFHLLHGRALEQANRLDDAIESYQQALDDVPAATSARVALVAALAKAKRGAGATRLAQEALLIAAAYQDPWTIYVEPDLRFWIAINQQFRKVVAR